MEHLQERVGGARKSMRRWWVDLDRRRRERDDQQQGREEPEPALPDDVALADHGAAEYLYRPGQLVAAADEAEEVRRALRESGDSFEREKASGGTVRFRLGSTTDIPSLVTRLRASGIRRVGPNHVVTWRSHIQWAPGSGPAVPAGPWEGNAPAGAGEGVRVGVVDTGVWDHPWFDGRVDFAPDPPEVADADSDGHLDHEAGHGTFVSGIVLQHAPAARVVARRAASSGGVTDEVAVAQAIGELHDVDLLNLSGGAYAHGDQPPVAILGALEQLWRHRPEVVVVAAAGNDNTERPFWPAAAKRVIAVGALGDGQPAAAAPFTNHGWWVDACAPGLKVHSTFLEWEGMGWPGDRTRESFDGWARWSGSSFATPYVTGVLAAAASGHGGDLGQTVHRLIHGPKVQRLAGLGAIVVDPA